MDARPVLVAVVAVVGTWALRSRFRFNTSPIPFSFFWGTLALGAFIALEMLTVQPVTDVAGKCALVTGASGGIGAVIASTLAREGVAKLIIAARQLDKLEEVAAEIRNAHPSTAVSVVRADVTLDADRSALVAAAASTFGECPLILVNNAGVERWKPFDLQTAADLELQLGLNLEAPIKLTHALWPQLTRTSGHVVNVGSLAGKAAVPYAQAYVASKFGLSGFTASLRLEQRLEGGPVSAHLVAPGFVSDVGMGINIVAASGVDEAEMMKNGASEAWETADAVISVIRYDEPERLVNHPPIRVPLVLISAFPRMADLAAHSPDFAVFKRMGAGLRRHYAGAQ